MKYMLMIVGSEGWRETLPEEQATVMEQHRALGEKLRAQNKYLGGAGLAPRQSAVTVHRRADNTHSVTPGPFSDARDAIGGFYLVEAASIDEAVQWAKRIPGSDPAKIEVREMFGG